MKHKKSSARAVALSPRNLVSKASLFLLMLASLSLMVISRVQPEWRAVVVNPINDAASPLLDVLSRPGEAIQDFRGWVGNLAHIYVQNETLRADNSRLLQWQKAAMQLQAENTALRDLLRYNAHENLGFVTAKVINDRGGPLTRSVMVNVGADQGVRVGQAVVNTQGLVGRVIESGGHSARLLLLTDINSRIPVISAISRERSIAAGNNTDRLTLLYAPEDSKMKVGEKIVTSGDGDAVPAGLEVGEIAHIENGVAQIRPYASWLRLEYVSIAYRR